jgi:glycine dehydrogenase subunit 1
MTHPYIPHTQEDREAMLAAVGADVIDDLFQDIPHKARQKGSSLPKGLSELEVSARLERLASKNRAAHLTCFRGGGVYDHYVPAIVDSVISRSEFYTAYTPYQPEISQGTLQYIFEYQSMIAELTGMEAVNASLYDGSTAAAEAMIMAFHAARGDKVYLSETVNPGVERVLSTYARFHGITIVPIPMENGVTDKSALENLPEKDLAAVIVQSPNYYGIIEDLKPLVERALSVNGLFIQITDPISLALLKSPGEWGADIVVGEAQPLGQSLNFGGPYLGFMGTTKKLMRKLPGRICGQTTDRDGKRAFVLTLQAREQHIRREKATSNICSNQSLCSLAAAVYMASMGKEGLIDVAEQCLRKACYTAEELEKTGKWKLAHGGPFFREFLIKPAGTLSPEKQDALNERLLQKGFLGGAAPECCPQSGALIISVTEKRTRSEIDEFVKIMGDA